MISAWSAVIILFILSVQAFAQEQMAVRINEQGIMKILELVVKYNSSSKEGKTFVIPQDIYKFTIPKKTFEKNPIIQVANQISDLNLTKDLDFYFNTSDIKVSGKVDPKSLKTEISNSHSNGFDLKLSLNIPSVILKGDRLALCETRLGQTKKCGEGLKATLNEVSISTIGVLKMNAVFRIQTDKEVVRIKLLSVESNLEKPDAPTLDINFKSIVIPKISILINGQETELDTSNLKNEIIKRKAFLGAKLLAFVADFIASDLEEMVNRYLINKTLATTINIYRRDGMAKFDELLRDPYAELGMDNYVMPIAEVKDRDPMEVILAVMADVIKNARLDLTLRKLSTPRNKDLELSGLVKLILNNRAINIGNTVGNTNQQLPPLDLTVHQLNDVNLAISEPLLNGALALVNSTGLYQEVFKELANIQGVSIHSVNAHFWGVDSLAVIANMSVNLRELKSSGVKEWLKHRIAAFLERSNNQATLYFPIQIEVTPKFLRHRDGSMSMELYVKSPFEGNLLRNTFRYPTNVDNASKVVYDGVMEKLKESLTGFTNKAYIVDINKFLNQSKVEFKPKYIGIEKGSYLVLDLDIVDIKFDSKK